MNGLINDGELLTCHYGHMLRCRIHYIVAVRARHLRTIILLLKADFDSAYRHGHTCTNAVAHSLMWIVIEGLKILLMILRLTFGGAFMKLCLKRN